MLVTAIMIASMIVTPLVTAMLCLITWHILAVIPAILHKIDTFAAGIVFAAVLAPVFCVARRDMQIYRLALDRCAINYPWLAINQLRATEITDILRPVITWMPDIDGYVDIGGMYGLRTQAEKGHRQ